MATLSGAIAQVQSMGSRSAGAEVRAGRPPPAAATRASAPARAGPTREAWPHRTTVMFTVSAAAGTDFSAPPRGSVGTGRPNAGAAHGPGAVRPEAPRRTGGFSM